MNVYAHIRYSKQVCVHILTVHSTAFCHARSQNCQTAAQYDLAQGTSLLLAIEHPLPLPRSVPIHLLSKRRPSPNRILTRTLVWLSRVTNRSPKARARSQYRHSALAPAIRSQSRRLDLVAQHSVSASLPNSRDLHGLPANTPHKTRPSTPALSIGTSHLTGSAFSVPIRNQSGLVLPSLRGLMST
jgi:hypothetical protein